MTKQQYLRALRELQLTPSGQETARRLGKKLRQCQYYAAGEWPVDETVALLLAMYLEHGLPAEKK